MRCTDRRAPSSPPKTRSLVIGSSAEILPASHAGSGPLRGNFHFGDCVAPNVLLRWCVIPRPASINRCKDSFDDLMLAEDRAKFLWTVFPPYGSF